MDFTKYPRSLHYDEPFPVWHKVLQAYRMYGGSGLSANALVYLTGVPWPTMRTEMNAWYRKYRDICTYRCNTVMAELFTYCIADAWQWNMDYIDKQIEKFPPESVDGINYGKAKKGLDDMYRSHETLPLLMQVVKEHNEQALAESLSAAIQAETESAE